MRLEAREILRHHHVETVEGLGQQKFAWLADIAAVGLVDEGQPTLGQLPQDELGLRLDQRPVTRLALAQGQLAPLALGDVAPDRLDLDQPAFAVEDAGVDPQLPMLGAIGQDRPHLHRRRRSLRGQRAQMPDVVWPVFGRDHQ